MKTKQKRVWTPEQRQAAADRMRALQVKRWAKQRETEDAKINFTEEKPVRDPEVQAVIDAMDPARKAKLAMVQRGVWQDNGRADGREAQEALARFEQAKRDNPVLQESAPQVPSNAVIPDVFNAMAAQVAPQRDPGRVGSREVSLIVRTDGTMVSQYGPCVCGRSKRQWHTICLKENQG